MGAAARQFVRLQQGATARTLDIMDEVIEARPTAPATAPI
jgi:hypothetical protein